MDKTTIQINLETLERIRNLKNFERQSYDEVLNSLIDNCEEESLNAEEISEIQRGLEDIKRGKVKPIESVARGLGITLR
ncbi:MAG: hypothetical protein KKB21_00205 [Nanoarchaeota archaeon]|nr:hypothetical protein [Nanoarchaeota archaeon]MBU4085981.1 hypothetical protein [Nanoarchaeota archaeon]